MIQILPFKPHMNLPRCMNADFRGATHATSCSVDLTAAYPEFPEGCRWTSLAARSETECFADTKWFLEKPRSRIHIRQERQLARSVKVFDFEKERDIWRDSIFSESSWSIRTCASLSSRLSSSSPSAIGGDGEMVPSKLARSFSV